MKQPLIVDSGAAETVIPASWFPEHPTVESEGSKAGRWYNTADVTPVYNEGEKVLNMTNLDGSVPRRMKCQVCDVGKALASVSKIVHAGNRVVFDEDASYIEDKKDGSRINLRERAGVFVLDAWVAPCCGDGGGKDFTRQAGPA